MPLQRRAPYNYEVVDGQRVSTSRAQRPAGIKARATADQRERQVDYELETVSTRQKAERPTVDYQNDTGPLLGWKPLGCVYGMWAVVATALFILCAISILWPRLNMDPWAFMALIFAVLFVATATARFEG